MTAATPPQDDDGRGELKTNLALVWQRLWDGLVSGELREQHREPVSEFGPTLKDLDPTFELHDRWDQGWHKPLQALFAAYWDSLVNESEQGGEDIARNSCGLRNVVERSLQGVAVVVGHHSLLSLHGLVSRHVADATISARRWLQGSGWVRRAVAILRPSGTTECGAR